MKSIVIAQQAHRPWLAIAASLSAATLTAYVLGHRKNMSSAYEATLAVPMKCQACCDDVSAALKQLAGVQSLTCNISSQSITVKSTESPSRIVNAIHETGRSAILRGSGDPNGAAVCILEKSLEPGPAAGRAETVRGLARLIQLNDTLTMLDLTLTGLSAGPYQVIITSSGNISNGTKSMGNPFRGLQSNREGVLGEFALDERGRGNLYCEIAWPVWEMVGRGLVVKSKSDSSTDGLAVGVIARSAGAWENDKVVCACSGKTVWQEREEMLARGIT